MSNTTARVAALLFLSLFPEASRAESSELGAIAVAATAKEVQAASQSGPFIAGSGDRRSERVSVEYGHEVGSSDEHRAVIEESVALYRTILQSSQRIAAASAPDHEGPGATTTS